MISLNSAYIECVNFLTINGYDKPKSISLISDFKTSNFSIFFFKIELFENVVFVKVKNNNTFTHCEFFYNPIK